MSFENLGETVKLFGAGCNLLRAASGLQKIVKWLEPSKDEKEKIEWATELFERLDWNTERYKKLKHSEMEDIAITLRSMYYQKQIQLGILINERDSEIVYQALESRGEKYREKLSDISKIFYSMGETTLAKATGNGCI